MRMRSGFTLVELLVASAVFVIGFVAVFALFLSGMRFRKLSDDTTMTAALATSMMGEIFIDSGSQGGTDGPAFPSDYIGDGVAKAATAAGAVGGEIPNKMQTQLFPYQSIPGAYYRVDACTDPLLVTDDPIGADNPFATAVYAEIVAICPGGTVSTYDDYNRRVRVFSPSDARITAADADQQIGDELVNRGIAMKYRAVIVRQPHWFFSQP
ncbi:MAG: prepilin-type N-terminal cleavage/methylation domain-containing protein [Planctomycetes bacterium]|nr:prepilin-type N-terminal cleavage/methylation domain-containing protein [Planctomycetota bacterium]